MTPLVPFRRSLPLASADLYGTYREYREREPVHKGEASHPRFPDHWFLFRHEDVSFVLKEPRFGRDWHPVVKTPPPPVDIPPGALSDLVAMVIQRGARFPLEDVEVGGVVLRRGSQVTPILGAANRDPEAFEQPDRLDVRRDARRHLAFGGGIHSCLGAPLARLEIRVALDVLLDAAPELAHDATSEPVWSEGIARGLDELPLTR